MSGHIGYHGLLSVDPNTIPAAVCSNTAGCKSGGGGATLQRASSSEGAQYIPIGTRPNPYLSGGFFWYTEGNSSYNALASRPNTAPATWLAISRQLHVVKKPRHEFRLDRRAK